jgi:integrase
MGLGPTHTVSLAEARQRAQRARLQLLDGLDPIETRKAARAATALEAMKSMSFEQAAREFLRQNETRWTNAKMLRQVGSQMQRFVYPVIGPLPVNAVDRPLVLRVLEQRHADHGGTTTLWCAIPETANRLRGRLEEILAWAAVRGYRSGENPAAWRGNLEHALPAPSTIAKPANHAALPYRELPAFMKALHSREGVSPRALEFLILTAARAGEVLGGRWDEIDSNNRVWTIPASRMKAGREHRVPLTDAAVELLNSLPREADNDFIFIGSKPGCGLGHASICLAEGFFRYECAIFRAVQQTRISQSRPALLERAQPFPKFSLCERVSCFAKKAARQRSIKRLRKCCGFREAGPYKLDKV